MKELKKKPSSEPKPKTDFGKAVARSLKRAAAAARVEAKRYGTRIHLMKDGKLVALKP